MEVLELLELLAYFAAFWAFVFSPNAWTHLLRAFREADGWERCHMAFEATMCTACGLLPLGIAAALL